MKDSFREFIKRKQAYERMSDFEKNLMELGDTKHPYEKPPEINRSYIGADYARQWKAGADILRRRYVGKKVLVHNYKKRIDEPGIVLDVARRVVSGGLHPYEKPFGGDTYLLVKRDKDDKQVVVNRNHIQIVED